MVPFSVTLSANRSQQVFRSSKHACLPWPADTRQERFRWPQSASSGADFRVVRVNGIDTCSLYEFDRPLDGGKVGRVIVGEKTKPQNAVV